MWWWWWVTLSMMGVFLWLTTFDLFDNILVKDGFLPLVFPISEAKQRNTVVNRPQTSYHRFWGKITSMDSWTPRILIIIVNIDFAVFLMKLLLLSLQLLLKYNFCCNYLYHYNYCKQTQRRGCNGGLIDTITMFDHQGRVSKIHICIYTNTNKKQIQIQTKYKYK